MQSDARSFQRLPLCAIPSALMLAWAVAVPSGGTPTADATPQADKPVPEAADTEVLAVASDRRADLDQTGHDPPPQPNPDAEAAPMADPVVVSDPPDPAPDDLAPEAPPTLPRKDDIPPAPPAEAAGVTPGAELPSQEVVQAKPASFHGVQPGRSTIDDATETWGQPVEVISDQDGASVHIYSLEDFPQVQVRLADDGIVASIVIELDPAVEAAALAKSLGMEEIRFVDIADAQGELLGRAFPERGVVLGFATQDEAARVRQIILETISAEPFVLRAENDLHGPYRANLRDLDYAMRQDPNYAHPYWLRARILVAVGQPGAAEHAAASAVGLAPSVPEYRLTWAQCLARLGRHAEAVKQVSEVLETSDLPPDVEARALMQRGDLVVGDGAPEGPRAIDYHVEAIKVAGRTGPDASIAVRRGATQTLIDAHLAVAGDIARGRWQQKSRVVSMWIDRAAKLADQTINQDGGSQELRLRVAQRALFALADVQPATDPARWVDAAEKAAAEALREVADPLWAHRIRRQLGTTYFHAVQLAHIRGQVQEGLHYGRAALDHLEPETDNVISTVKQRFLLGQLYFQMGAILAVHRKDHHKAVRWYDRAAAGLVQPTPMGPAANPRRHGDALVSMGVSYWEVDEREKALELTKFGAEMIKQAVASGSVDETALAVPYGNLATMHGALGDTRQARGFAELAKGSRR